MRILQVVEPVIDAAWPHVRPWLEKANAKGGGRYPLEDFRKDVENGKKMLFKLVQGNCFTWLLIGCLQNSEHKTCIVYSMSGQGTLKMLPEIVPACEGFARHNGCKYLVFSGRKGWVKELNKYGWKEINRTCAKEML